MKIVLISPKGPLYRHRTGIFRKSLRAAPLTLTTLAALVPAELNAEIKIYDEGVEDLPTSLDADLIGMTVITGTAPRVYELAALFRKQSIPVVLGGPHVTLAPDEAAMHADAIVTGYAERTWPQLLRDLVAGGMKRRYDMAPDFSLSDPSDLPMPRRDLLGKKAYTTIDTFEATRGCVHDCSFCVVPSAWGRRPFQKPVAHVVDEIRRTGARKLIFYDLNLIAARRYAHELFDALIPLNVQWFGLATTLLDDAMIEHMAQSGCRGLLIGFESLSRSVLSEVRKPFNKPEHFAELVRNLHDAGILINGTFVFGSDGDGEDEFDAVEDFVMSTGVDLPRFSILTPFPGTPLYRRLDAEGRILSRDWSLYDGQHVVFEPRQMSSATLLARHEQVWRSVYSARGIVERTASRVFQSFGRLPILLGANLGYRYYARNLARFYTCDGGVA